jgi:hypothetical protein
VEQKGHILVGALTDLRSDTDVRDGRPGIEEIVKKFHKVGLTDSIPLASAAFLLLCNHFERNSGLVSVTTALQNLHVLYEVLKVDLLYESFTYSSLSRSKALNIRSENYWAQCKPKMPIFFLKDSLLI